MLAVFGAVLFPSNASALRFTDESYFVPKGVVGKPYLHVFELAKGGGTAPYTWALAGPVKLPAGLTLEPTLGTIRGTPEAPGTFPLTVYVKDAKGAVGIAKATLQVQPASDRTPDSK